MKNEKTKYAKVIVLLLFLSLFSVGSGFSQIAGLSKRIMSEMGLTSAQYYAVHSAPMYCSLFLGLFIGTLSGKYGIKRIISIGLIISCVGYIIRPFVSGYLPLFLCMILAGFGSAFIGSNSAKIISYWYPENRVGPALGLVLAGSNAAFAYGLGISPLFPTIRVAFTTNAVLVTIVTVLWLIFFKEAPEKTSARQVKSDLIGIPIKESLFRTIKCKNVWLLGVSFACHSVCNLIVVSFFSVALQSRGVSEGFAGLATAFVAVGSVLGAIFGSRICRRLPRAKPFLLSVCVVLGLCCAFAWKLPVAMTPLAMVAHGFCVGTLMVNIQAFPPLLPEIGPKYAGGAGGLLVTFQGIGVAVLPTYFILPITGDNHAMTFIVGALFALPIFVAISILPDLNHIGR